MEGKERSRAGFEGNEAGVRQDRDMSIQPINKIYGRLWGIWAGKAVGWKKNRKKMSSGKMLCILPVLSFLASHSLALLLPKKLSCPSIMCDI